MRRERLSLAGVTTSLVLLGGCAEARRSLGEDCLKDNDCLSGTCLQLLCAPSAPTTDARAVNEAASGAALQPLADAAPDSPGGAD